MNILQKKMTDKTIKNLQNEKAQVKSALKDYRKSELEKNCLYEEFNKINALIKFKPFTTVEGL